MADLTGGLQIGAGPTSEVYTTPFPHTHGARARDAQGNEYVFVDFVGTVFGRQCVQINTDFTAQAITTTGRGPIGVAVRQATSDQAGWVQIYGRCLMQLMDSGVSPSDPSNGPTTLGTSAATRFWLSTSVTSPQSLRWTSGNTSTTSGIIVEGMTVATDASVDDVSAQTSGTSIAGGIGTHSGNQIAVFLNYPHVIQRNYGE